MSNELDLKAKNRKSIHENRKFQLGHNKRLIQFPSKLEPNIYHNLKPQTKKKILFMEVKLRFKSSFILKVNHHIK